MKKFFIVVIVLLAGAISSSYAADKATLSEFIPAYAHMVSGKDMDGLVKLSNLSLINKRMTPEQMTDFMGNTLSQAKAIYGMYKSKDGLMTPLEFTHYLSDKIFDSAAGAFVSKKQKEQLRLRMKVMDLTNSKILMSANDIVTLLNGFEIDDISLATVARTLESI